MWAVRVYDPEGEEFYDDYYFHKKENARAFLKKKIEEFIQVQIDRGYEPQFFGFNSYERMLKSYTDESHHEIIHIAYIYEIETED